MARVLGATETQHRAVEFARFLEHREDEFDLQGIDAVVDEFLDSGLGHDV